MKCLLLVLVFALPIYGQKESAKPNGQQNHSDSASKPSPSPITQNTAPENGNGAANDPKSYLSRLFSPENLPNIGLFFAGIIGIIIAICTLKEMQRAGEQASKQLGLTERPWISPSAYIISPLTADENGIHITLRIEVANVGNSPAVGIWIEPSLYLQHVSKPSVVDERKRICEQVIARSPKWGQILFPKGDPYIQGFTIGATTEDIAKSRLGVGNMPDVLAATIILCVSYRSTIDDKAKHYTAMIYDLSRFDPKRPNLMLAFMAGESVPQDQIRLWDSVFGPIAE